MILLAISVADGWHILGQYYFELARAPERPKREIVIRSMMAMWRPVTITSVTTIAGFLAVYAASSSPPMKDFGAFAALGVAVALIVSLLAVPPLLLLLPAKLPRAFAGIERSGALPQDVVGAFLRRSGDGILRRPVVVTVVALLVALGGVAGLLRLEANDSDLDNFQKDEPLRIAHSAINETFDGAHNLDIVIETQAVEALFEPGRLQRIEALQVFAESLPHVTASRSIVDYLKQLNRVLHDDDGEAYRLPDSEEAVAQYFLLYSMSGDPADFEEEVDYDYRLANIRVTLDSGEFQDEQAVVVALERYITDRFDSEDMTARVSGRAAVHYHWMVELLEGHFLSVLLALAVVGVTAVLAFRSPLYGCLALLPVALSVLLIYAVMGLSGIWLGIGTSMSAAIAIGVGVDFAVHVIDRIKAVFVDARRPLSEALQTVYQLTGRALLFNFLIIFCGFGLLVISETPGLIRFGCLVAIAVATSFITSLSLLPVLIQWLRPAAAKGETESFTTTMPGPLGPATD